MLARGNEICFNFNFNFNDALVSSTRTLPVKIFTWKKEKPCSPKATKFVLILILILILMMH